MTDLAEIEAALKAATTGEWWGGQDGDWTIIWGLGTVEAYAQVAKVYRDADAHLIANAPTWLAELLERVKAAEGMLDSVTRQLEQAVDERNYRISERNAAEATVARVRALTEEHPGTAWNSGLNLRQALRDALGGTPTDATEGASSAGDERNRFSGEDADEPTQPILRPTDQRNWDRPEVALIRHMGGRTYARVGAHKWTELPKFGQVIVTEDLVAQQHEEIAVFTSPRTAQRYEPPADDHESGCCR